MFRHRWAPIRCFTTRAAREVDPGRICVDSKEYTKMERDNEFFLSNRQFGECYGTYQADIDAAMTSQQHFVLDFRIKDQDQLASIFHLKILLSVEDENQLRKHVHLAGRLTREKEILDEYRTHYSRKMLDKYTANGFHSILNSFDMLDTTADCIAALAKATL